MIVNSIKFGPIWLIVFILISINTVDGQQPVEVTTISVEKFNEKNNESNISELSFPQVQTRFFNWLTNGLNGQSSGGLNGLGGLLRPNSGSGSPFSGLGASLGSAFGGNNGFGMRPLSNELSQMSRPQMGRPPMGLPPMGPPPMGRPPMGQMGQMGQYQFGLQPPMGQMSQMGQSQFGSQPPMGSQSGMSSNYGGQPNNQMGGQMGQIGGQMATSTDDYGDYGGMSTDNTVWLG